MSGFTPGPWVIGRSGHGRPYQVETAGGLCITKWGGISRPASAEGEANAQLIAAAPELLDALESLKCELILSDVDMDYIESHFRPWLDKAAAAIAKARGTA